MSKHPSAPIIHAVRPRHGAPQFTIQRGQSKTIGLGAGTARTCVTFDKGTTALTIAEAFNNFSDNIKPLDSMGYAAFVAVETDIPEGGSQAGLALYTAPGTFATDHPSAEELSRLFSPQTVLRVTASERDTIIAALRYYEEGLAEFNCFRRYPASTQEVAHIVTGGNCVEIMPGGDPTNTSQAQDEPLPAEIDALCSRLFGEECPSADNADAYDIVSEQE